MDLTATKAKARWVKLLHKTARIQAPNGKRLGQGDSGGNGRKEYYTRWINRAQRHGAGVLSLGSISHVKSNLQAALRGSPSPAPNRLLLLPPLSAGIGRLFPADLPARGEMWKVRDKNVFYRVRGSFLVQKGRKYLCGILFFSPLFIQKIQRDSLSLMRMSALNLLGLD